MRKPVSIKMRNHVNKVLQMSPMVNTSMKVMSTGAPLLDKDKTTKKLVTSQFKPSIKFRRNIVGTTYEQYLKHHCHIPSFFLKD